MSKYDNIHDAINEFVEWPDENNKTYVTTTTTALFADYWHKKQLKGIVDSIAKLSASIDDENYIPDRERGIADALEVVYSELE